jgi:hypothetical protein
MTDMTVMSAVTLIAIHTIDTVEMKEMNWLRRFARVYRSPMKSSRGLNIPVDNCLG